MLFPNHPAFAEIRPGMGYAPGARNFGDVAHMGYSSGAFHLGYAPGARNFSGDASHTLGDVSTSMKNAAVTAGIDTNDIDLLDSVGATDQDFSDLINGNTTLTALYAKYGVTISTPATGTGTSPTSAPTSTAQVPGGSTLLYTANWSAGVGNLSESPTSVLSELGSALAAHGMSVVNGQATSSGPIHYGIQVTVLDTIGNALLSDARSILDALMHQIVGNNVTGTNLSLISSPGQSTAAGASLPASDPVTWLEDNALYIALGIGGLVLLNNFTGGKRR